MIDKIQLVNFQGHLNTVLELDPHLNVIVGTSDAGKSSVIRFVQWLAEGRPLGDRYTRHGETEARGRIRLTDGTVIGRVKGKDSRYLLNGEEFRAVGTTVPEPILNALNLSHVNLQGQRNIDFLLADSPGEVGRKLNEVVGLSDIDKALSFVASKIRVAENGAKVTERAIHSGTEALTKLHWVPAAEGSVESINQAYSQIKTRKLAKNRLQGVAQDLVWVSDRLKDFAHLRGLKRTLDASLTGLEQLRERYRQRDNLLELVTRCRGKMETIERIQMTLTDAKEQWNKLKPETCPLCDGKGSL